MSTPAPRLAGIIPPVSTPYAPGGGIDRAAFDAIARHLHEGGVDAAFVLGSTGENASLSLTRRIEAVDAAAAGFRGRLPLLVGIGDPCLDHSLALAEKAAAAGAAAVVLNAPSYYEISPAEMRGYLDLILPRLPLPVLLYNMPWLTGHVFDEATIRHAMGFEGLLGFKDSSGDAAYFASLVRLAGQRPELVVLVGNDFLFHDFLKLGAHGAVAGGSALYPGLFRRLLDAHHAGDPSGAEFWQREITARGSRIFPATGHPSSVFATIKGGLATLGLCRPDMAPPIQSCAEETLRLLKSILLPAAAA